MATASRQRVKQVLAALTKIGYRVIDIDAGCTQARLELGPQALTVVQGEPYVAAVRVANALEVPGAQHRYRVGVSSELGVSVEEIDGAFLTGGDRARALQKLIEENLEC